MTPFGAGSISRPRRQRARGSVGLDGRRMIPVRDNAQRSTGACGGRVDVVAATLLAGYLPVRDASRIDPRAALRHE